MTPFHCNFLGLIFSKGRFWSKAWLSIEFGPDFFTEGCRLSVGVFGYGFSIVVTTKKKWKKRVKNDAV